MFPTGTRRSSAAEMRTIERGKGGMREMFNRSLGTAAWLVGLLYVFTDTAISIERTATTKVFDSAAERVFKVGIANSISSEFKGHGTAFVVAKEGFMATAFHVVDTHLRKMGRSEDRDQIFVIRNGARIPAEVWGVDSQNDLAILRVPLELPEPWALLKAPPPRGTPIFAIGFPGPAEFAVVSGTLQSATFSEVIPTYQITAPVAGGMSGGPVTDTNGKVIGATLAGFTGAGEIGLVGPSTAIARLLERVRGRTERPDRLELDDDVRRGYSNLQEQESILIARILGTRTPFFGWLLPGKDRENSDLSCSERIPSAFATLDGATASRICSFKRTARDDSVWFELSFNAIPWKKNRFQAAYLAGREANARNYVLGFRNFGKLACRPEQRLEHGGRTFLVSICSRLSNSFADAFHTVVRVTSVEPGQPGLVARLELMGFSRRSSETLAAALVKSLEVDLESEFD